MKIIDTHMQEETKHVINLTVYEKKKKKGNKRLTAELLF